MRVRTSVVVFIMVFGGLLVLHQGTMAQSSCATASECNDGNSCTDDACDAGACTHILNGSCTANPKTLGYWRQVCRGGGNTEEFLTQADVDCVGPGSDCPYYTGGPVHTVEGLCAALHLSNDTGQDMDCNRGYEQVLALQLNICRGRLTRTQQVDIEFCGGGNVSSTHDVNYALALAGNSVCADSFPTHCSDYVCVPKSINQGRALHVSGLIVSRLSTGGLHLVWTPPLAELEALTTTPHSYRVWRASGSDGTFVQIAEVSDPSFDDAAAEGDYLRYDVTPVW